MEITPLNKNEKKVLLLLLKQNENICDKTILITELDLNQNIALNNLCQLNLAFKSDITSETRCGITELGKRTALGFKDEAFWKKATFWIPTAISLVSTVISLIALLTDT